MHQSAMLRVSLLACMVGVACAGGSAGLAKARADTATSSTTTTSSTASTASTTSTSWTAHAASGLKSIPSTIGGQLVRLRKGQP